MARLIESAPTKMLATNSAAATTPSGDSPASMATTMPA
jgi:hypothetical protein